MTEETPYETIKRLWQAGVSTERIRGDMYNWPHNLSISVRKIEKLAIKHGWKRRERPVYTPLRYTPAPWQVWTPEKQEAEIRRERGDR